jgi:hypothetical protein
MNSKPKDPLKYVNCDINSVLAVVGNKIDKTDDEEVPFNEAK